MKLFNGLDHNYLPDEQHIEARVAFPVGLQSTNTHKDKFWHARGMAFMQYSLSGTALSWYICLSDTYKQFSYAFVQDI